MRLFRMLSMLFPFVLLVSTAVWGPLSAADEAVRPLKVLLVAGGCCHDYANQKDNLKIETQTTVSQVQKKKNKAKLSRQGTFENMTNRISDLHESDNKNVDH